MQCKLCDYRLWGTKTRECPECGTQFLPSQYEFVPNSVRFCCPHCSQDYYGTGERGHLVPEQFQCVRCGENLCMDNMVLFPTEGVREEQTQVDRMPWLDKKSSGFFRRWMRTIWMGLFSPIQLMRLTPTDSAIGPAWWFAFLTSAIACFGGFLPLFAFPLLMMPGGVPSAAIGVFGVPLLSGLLIPSLIITVWGITIQAILAMSGKRWAGLGRTYQAVCYSSAANIVTIVPCFGFYLVPVAWLWWCICAILMIWEGQKVSTLRAISSVLLFPVSVIVGGSLLGVLVLYPAAQSARNSARQMTGTGNTTSLGFSIRSYANTHSGKPPNHISELMVTSSASEYAFVNSDFQALAKVPVGSTNLERFSDMPVTAQQAEVQAAARALPPNVVAHRLGDFVFTYHGIDFKKADPSLWIAVLAPEGKSAIDGQVQITMVGNTTTTIAESQFANALKQQNTLRCSQGLAPLPNMHNVTHTQPASASMPASNTSR